MFFFSFRGILSRVLSKNMLVNQSLLQINNKLSKTISICKKLTRCQVCGSLQDRVIQRRCLSTDKDLEVLSKIRNVGIVAHIDAGKTTTTERMLFYSGLTDGMGEVHDGDTVTDYMEQERERGITITSAAVTFPWKKHRINLIDTPGHVDFTVEVERSLCVLDSALVVLDASAGVEAQTVTVWSQADRHSVPRVVYLNKMDKPTADVDLCLKSIKKLGSKPLLLHLPVFNGSIFSGILDVVSMKKMMWRHSDEPTNKLTEGYGDNFTVEDIVDKSELEKSRNAREELIASLADHDEQMSNAVLESSSLEDISGSLITNSLRRSTIKRHFVPVMIGSSYRKIAVQPLMDGVLSLLPSPLEVSKRNIKYFEGHFCGLAFKVIHHKMLGPLTFIRIYSGQVKPGSKIYNLSRSRQESISRIYIACADEFKEIPVLTSGNILVATGLECVTGDTLISSSSILETAKENFLKDHPEMRNSSEDSIPFLTGPSVPDPVFFCSIEPPSPSKEKNLEKALKELQREDPSLKVTTDENGQVVLSGMGELHIDIVKDRILKEYDVKAYLGPLQVAYREAIDQEVTHEMTGNRIIAGVKNFCKLTLVLKPQPLESKNSFKVHITRDNDLGNLRPDRARAVENGVVSALSCGPLLNFPVIGVKAELHLFETTGSTSLAFIASTASSCVAAALKDTPMSLLEPLMKLEISVPVNYSTKIISDLSSRRSQLGSIYERHGLRFIDSVTPLSELMNYSTVLRTISSGTASLSMELQTYQRMSESEKRVATEKVTGFSSQLKG